MMDRRRRADLEGAQALGRLADAMVFSLGRALREDDATPLTDADLDLFVVAAELFELLATDVTTVPDRPEGMMFSASGYLDALHVVQERAVNEEAEEYAGALARALRTVVDRGTVSPAERNALESLRELFADVGEATLSRAGELSLPEEAYWPPMRQAI